jgi:DNA mismatch repair ATPase MutS
MLPVWSSIQNEDSLDTADSLYMAEMRRCETLLAVAERPASAVFILDEIFRGTNHVESVSAAAAVVNQLSSRALVVVSSHHLVLAPLLQLKLDALRMVNDSGTLTLEPGILLETNGIDMMKAYAIPEEVRATAVHVRDWLAGHMTRPDKFPELL